MNATTLKALKSSIKHWERLSTGNRKCDEEAGHQDCALCDLFAMGRPFNKMCCGCPVKEKTGLSGCAGQTMVLASSITHRARLRKDRQNEETTKNSNG